MALPLPSSPLVGLFVSLCLILSFWLYRVALPKPIPGIPYNKHASSRLLGDLPELTKHMQVTKEMTSWLVNQCRVHNSPIVQVFARPFQKPVTEH